MGIGLLKELNFPVYIISSEVNPVVSQRAKEIKYRMSSKSLDKAKIITELADQKHKYKAIFVGNDINDIPALEIVGLQ